MKIAIIDYGAGNVQSVLFALERLGFEGIVTNDWNTIKKADKVIFPGVGEASSAMKMLMNSGLDVLIPTLKQPVLGICLGMQLLFDTSFEHGETKGLGLIPGQVLPFPKENQLRIPHMGWNQLQVNHTQPLTEAVVDQYVYYVHSYYVDCAPEFILATSDYGVAVPAIVRRNHVYGMQFHPEKSGEVGQALLKAFKKVVEA